MTTLRLADREIPRVGLGTNRLTTAGEEVDFLRAAVAAGLRHVDTAHLYTGGESEQAVGAALDGLDRGELVVATKGGFRPGEGRPEVLRAQVEQSLRALRTDAIDLYYLHRVDPQTPLAESLGALSALVDGGAIRHVGISDVSVEQIEQARAIVPIAAVQNRYNIADREHDDVVDHCAAQGIAFVPYYPLKGDGPPAVAEIADRHGVGAERGQGRLAAAPLADDAPDPRHALARAPPREPRRAGAEPQRRGGRRARVSAASPTGTAAPARRWPCAARPAASTR